MDDYKEMFTTDIFHSDLLDDYLKNTQEYDINQLDIIHLFGKERLETIQKSLSMATGVAFVTVNFRGEPITEVTSITPFCDHVRSCKQAMEQCKASDAFGSIQAAVMKKPNIYFCPCNLLEVAIPIIVKGHYLGGFIGGQVRCQDAPKEICHLSSVMNTPKTQEMKESGKEIFETIPEYSYKKFEKIADLVFMVINLLSESEINKHVKEDYLSQKLKKVENLSMSYLKENENLRRQILKQQAMSSPYELMDVLSSLLNLTTIEKAPRTKEVLSTYIEYVKYKFANKSTFLHVSDELEHAEEYLLLQQKRTKNHLTYSIFVPKEVHMQKIPSKVLLPFIQNAVYNGVLLKKGIGKVTVTGYLEKGSVFLVIEDDGPGYSKEELDYKYEVYKEHYDGYHIKLGMEYAKEKLKQLFEEDFKIAIENIKNIGTKSVIRWPQHYDERKD